MGIFKRLYLAWHKSDTAYRCVVDPGTTRPTTSPKSKMWTGRCRICGTQMFFFDRAALREHLEKTR